MKKKKSTPKKPRPPRAKAVAPVKSTSGASVAMETKVAALAAGNLLAGRSPLRLTAGRLTRIDFQVRSQHWHFDDLLLSVDTPMGECRCALSVRDKREITVGGFSQDLKDALCSQFTQPAPNPFRLGIDRLVLVSKSHGEAVATAADALTGMARGNPADMAGRLRPAGAASAEMRTLFADLDATAVLARGSGTNPATGDLLRAFYLEEMDLTALAELHPSQGIDLCSELLRHPSPTQAASLWEALLNLCASAKHPGGYLDLPKLLDALRGRFHLRDHPSHAADWLLLNRESDGHVQRVIDTIANRRVDRQAQADQLAQSVAANPVTVLVGPSGSGKSSLAKRLYQSSAHSRQCWTHVPAWPREQVGTLAAALLGPPLEYSMQELFAGISEPRALLVVDAVEHCTTPAQLGHLTALLRCCRLDQSDSPWRVLLVATVDDWGATRARLAEALPNFQPFLVPVGHLTAPEAKQLTREIPGLASIGRQPHLTELLQRPKILSFLAAHVQKGGTLDSTQVTGESHLARLFWQSRICTDGAVSRRGRAMMQLSEIQADRSQSEVPQRDLDVTLADAFNSLCQDGFCVSRDHRVALQHDLYGDWTRFEILVAEGDNAIAATKTRVSFPQWHRAIRLYGVWLLEKDTGGVEAWAQTIIDLSGADDATSIVADLFLEAPLFSARPLHMLETVWPRLVSGQNDLLKRMLKRVQFSASEPSRTLVSYLTKQYPAQRDQWNAEYRQPYPQFWLPLLAFLHNHAAEAVKLTQREVAQVAEKWLRTATPGSPGRDHAAELAMQVAEKIQALTARREFYGDGETIAYRAAILAAPELPARLDPLLRKLAGLLPADGRKQFPEKRRILVREGFGKFMGPGIEYDLPAPWPGGPSDDPNHTFSDLVLEEDGLATLAYYLPALAKDLALAVCISPPEIDDAHHRRREDREAEGVIHGVDFYPPFYTRGPFFLFLRVNAEHGLKLILDLVNFYTERWLDWLTNGRPKLRPKLVLRAGAKQEKWWGDNRLYFAGRGAVTINRVVASALIALEKWLLDRIEAGENVDETIDFILAHTRSLAVAGVLVSTGKRQPSLLFRQLRRFVASPDLHSAENRQHSLGFNESTPVSFDLKVPLPLAQEWDELAHRKLSLPQACAAFFQRSGPPPACAQLVRQWKALATNPSVHPDFLQSLIELFEPKHWRKADPGKEGWVFSPPARPPKPPSPEQIAAQEDRILFHLPGRCRELLQAGKPLDELSLENLWQALDQLPQKDILDDDGHHPIISRADAQCGIVAVLVRLGSAWLKRHPDRRARCGAIILQHLSAPPRAPRFFHPDNTLSHMWDNFCAEVAPAFLADDPASPVWREAVGQLASRPHHHTTRVLFQRASELRAQLGNEFSQMIRLLILVAAARQLESRLKYEPQKPFRWEVWWPELLRRFITSDLPEPPDDWEKIDLLAGAELPECARRAPAVDLSIMVAGLEWMPLLSQAKSPAERTQWVRWLRSLLQCLVRRLQSLSPDRDRPTLPYDGENAVLGFIARRVASAPAADRKALWEPLLAEGGPAKHYIDHYLAHFLPAGLGHPPATPDFIATWREMLGWAQSAPAWQFTADRHGHEVRQLWWALLAFETFNNPLGLPGHTALVATLKPDYERWASLDLTYDRSAERFMSWLRGPAMAAIVPESLVWLAGTLDTPAGKRWLSDNFKQALSRLLTFAWHGHEAAIRNHPAAFAAFNRLLMVLVAEHNPAALALQARLGRS